MDTEWECLQVKYCLICKYYTEKKNQGLKFRAVLVYLGENFHYAHQLAHEKLQNPRHGKRNLMFAFSTLLWDDSFVNAFHEKFLLLWIVCYIEFLI